ncbi:unnamed protein product [Microthlaspi erraticum]|uniref:Uncharacterized protein n=1 Tax=Microthlaspi erraticum TaxID=1685480 RepID=A0A6D2IIJ6_9BRAS|nr:unnamed protein product [Microthlaspi erraticum]
MRIEGEKGVKTQSAPNIGRGRAKVNLAEQFHSGRPPVEPGRNSCARPDSLYRATETVRATRTNRERLGRDRPILHRNGPTVPVDPGNNSASAEISRPFEIWPTKSLDRDKIHRPSAQTFLGQGKYTMAKTKGNESMKKKKNPFMEPPKKQIKLGSSSSNARAAIPTSPHSIDAIKNMWRVQEEEKMIGHL